MKFTYKAQTKDGNIVSGEAEARDKFALASRVKKAGQTVLSVEAVDENKGLSLLAPITNIISGVRIRDRILFARNLSTMIKAGLPFSRALSILERQARNKKLKNIIQSIQERIKGGGSFHESLIPFPDTFSPLFIAMVKAGEESGTMSESLAIIAKHLESTYNLIRRVKSALMYPAIIIIAMGIIGVLMLVYVVPTLSATFEDLGVDLPPSTQLIVSVSEFLKNSPFFALGILFVFASLLYIFFRSSKGHRMWDTILLRIPVIGEIAKKVNSARTTRTLSSLLSSGVQMVPALSITREVLQNSNYKKVIAEAEARIQKGEELSDIFSQHEDIYPVLVGEMMAVGEETGHTSEMLSNVAEFYEEEVERVTKDLGTIIEPVLMVIIGALVGFFAFAMITPLYTVLGGI